MICLRSQIPISAIPVDAVNANAGLTVIRTIKVSDSLRCFNILKSRVHITCLRVGIFSKRKQKKKRE